MGRPRITTTGAPIAMDKLFNPVAHDLGGGVHFLAGITPAELVWANHLFDEVWQLHPAEKHRIMMHGRLVETPRWQQAYGRDYHYTGRTNAALPLPHSLAPLLAWVRSAIEERLNGVLVNWYDGPTHYIGPHQDSIKGIVPGTPIVTASFGETRVFRLTKGKGAIQETLDFPAPSGTVFAMPWDTNLAWKHSVPKSARHHGRRISVTFRAFNAET